MGCLSRKPCTLPQNTSSDPSLAWHCWSICQCLLCHQIINTIACTNPISIKVGTLSKNAIKTKICNLFIHLNLYLTDKRTKKSSVFSLINLVKYNLNINKFWNWCLQHTPKLLGQRHVYHWVTSPFLLITLCNHLGTEDINCCSFASGIFAHSWCIQDLSCSTVRGRRCLILLFMMRHTFSIGDRSGLQAGQSSTRTLCLRSHAVVTRAEWGLALSCWNRHGVPGKSRHLDGSICLSKIPT